MHREFYFNVVSWNLFNLLFRPEYFWGPVIGCFPRDDVFFLKVDSAPLLPFADFLNRTSELLWICLIPNALHSARIFS